MNPNETTQETSNETEINLSDMFFLLLNKLWIILIAAVALGICAFVYFKVFVHPTYTTNASIYIDTELNIGSPTTGLTATTNLAKDYRHIIKSERILAPVIDKLGLKTTPAGLASHVTVVAPEEGVRILGIKVTYGDPEMAKKISDAIVETSAKILPEYSEFSKIKITPIETANVPRSPSAPHVTRNTILAALIGGIVAAVVIVIVYMFNDKIKTPEDIKKYLDVSVLGVIPNLHDKQKKWYGRYGHYGKYGKYSSYGDYGTKNENK